MNAQTIDRNDINVVRFEPEDENQRIVARITRMMLHYWTLRTMIERNRASAGPVSQLMTQKAKQVRIQGFRDEADALKNGLKLAPHQPLFDDEKLRQQGTRIAYHLASVPTNFEAGNVDRAVELLNEALSNEEEIVMFEVYRALYDMDALERLAA